MTHQPPQRQPHEQSEYEAMNEQPQQMQHGGGTQMTGMQSGAQSAMQPRMQSGSQQRGTTGTSGRSSQMGTGMEEMRGQMESQGMQQQPQPQPQMQIQQQPQAQPQQTGGARSFEDHLTNELRIALEDFTELSHVAGWCAKECAGMGPQMQTCARICHDIAEIAELNEKMIARDSMFGPELAETFIRVATEGLPEIRQYSQQHPHIAETAATIERTMNSCETVLGMAGQQGQTGQMYQQGQQRRTSQQRQLGEM